MKKPSWVGSYFISYYPGTKEEFDKENIEFDSTLDYQYISRGRSAARAVFKDSLGNHYEMFSRDLTKLIHEVGDIRSVTGKWSFRKQGQNVGLVYLGN